MRGVPSARMRGGGLYRRILTVFGGCVLNSTGCEDLPLCQSEVFVAFDQTVISVDLDAVAPGVQTEIHVRTSLRAGDTVTLEVEDAEGATLGAYTRRVAADRSATFAGVAVSAPRVTLHAIGRGTCGEGDDEITVE